MERYGDSIATVIMTPSFLQAIHHSFRYCEQLVKDSGSNFYFGMLLTPEPKRQAVYAIYAWMREIDDIADCQEPTRIRHQNLLRYYRKTRMLMMSQEPPNPAEGKHWLAFYKTIKDYKIPLKYFKEMVLGQLQVIHQKPIETFSDLYRYCYRVASTVGLILIHIWGYCGGEKTEKAAEYRGIAFQLTNILRDIIPDAHEGMSYLPKDMYNDSIAKHAQDKTKLPKKLEQTVKDLIFQTQNYFEKSASLEQFVHEDGFISLRVMSDFYFSIFKKIRNNPIIIFKTKVSLGNFKKLYLILKILFEAKVLRNQNRTK